MSRIDQVNELLKAELASLINREITIENSLVTISYVDCSPDLSSAKIGISVLPEKYFGTVLEQLRKSSSQFTSILKKKLSLKTIPKFNWVIDKTEKEARSIEEVLEQIKNERG